MLRPPFKISLPLAAPSGVCVDLARFGVETLRETETYERRMRTLATRQSREAR